MSLPSCNHETRNYVCMRTIVTDIVSEGLRIIFKQEWNNRYQSTLGAWDNTPISGQALYNLEKGRPRTKQYLPKFQKGNTDEWDCTVLFDAILYSIAIGQAGLNPSIKKEVDNLRNLRNEILYVSVGQLPEHEFEDASEKVRKSFEALGLPTKEIDKIKIERKRVTSFHVLPSQPTHEVIPRSDSVSAITDDLHKLYSTNDGKLTYFYISGNPGSGKSQLARQLGESHYIEEISKQGGLTFVMTLNANSLGTLLESYKKFARRLNCTDDTVASIINSTETTEVKILQLRTQIATRIKSYKSWLLIVDNVENLNLVSPLLPQLGNEEWNGGQVLITTQECSSIPPKSSCISHASVSTGMRATESCQLLATLSGTGDHPMLGEVAKQLDYQPLALAAAAIYLKQVTETKVPPVFSWNKYLEKLEVGKKQLTKEQRREIKPTYSLTMTTAVQLAVDKAAENDVVLKHAFHFLSLASHESLPLDVVINYVLLVDKNQDKEEVGVKIRKCSLILVEDQEDVSIRLHHVVHDGMKVYAKKSKMKEIVNSLDVAGRLFYQFKFGNDDSTLVPHLGAFHAAMTNMLPSKKTWYLENTSTEIWNAFSYFGAVLHRHGECELSKQFYNAALNICLKQHGSNNDDVITSYTNLGCAHYVLGDLQQAKQYYERALDIRIKHLGSNHIDVATSYNNLGVVHQDLVDLQQAKQYYERALNIRIKQSGSNHIDVASSYDSLGIVHQDLCELQQAKGCYERAVDIRIKHLGSSHIDVASSYDKLGNVQQDLGDLQQAKLYRERALDIRIKQLGCNHVQVAGSYHNLGSVHQALGDLHQAKQYHERALDIRIKQLGSNHVHVADSYDNLGNVYQLLGDLQQAKQYYERALDIRTKQAGSNHVKVAASYNNMGVVYRELGDLQEAKQYHERALDIRIKQFGSNHVDVASSFTNLGVVHLVLGDLQQAKQYHERALDIRIKQLGSDNVDVASSCNNLGNVHLCLGDLQQAKRYHERALDIRIKQLGANHIDVASSYDNLGSVHQDLGDMHQAKQYHQRSLDIRIKQLGSNHVEVAGTYSNLGNVHHHLGDLQAAKENYELGLGIRIEQLGSNHVDVAASFNNLGVVHKSLGNLQKAKQYHERALDIRIEQLGSNHVDVAASFNNLGVVHKGLGDLQKAEQYHGRALDIRIRQLQGLGDL